MKYSGPNRPHFLPQKHKEQLDLVGFKLLSPWWNPHKPHTNTTVWGEWWLFTMIGRPRRAIKLPWGSKQWGEPQHVGPLTQSVFRVSDHSLPLSILIFSEQCVASTSFQVSRSIQTLSEKIPLSPHIIVQRKDRENPSEKAPSGWENTRTNNIDNEENRVINCFINFWINWRVF